MPKTRTEKFIMGILMTITMTYGMETFNVANQLGYGTMPGSYANMTNSVFLEAITDAPYMYLLVFLFSNLWGNRLGQGLARKIIRPQQDSPFFILLMISSCTVLIMCPTMSAAASIIFNVILGGAPITQFPAIWIGTIIRNYPVALLWNLFAAGPISRFLFRKICRREEE